LFGCVFDVEADGLDPTKIYVMSATTDGETIGSTPDYSDMQKLLSEQEVLVGHNIARWDIPALERLLEVKIPEDTLIVDTLALSWYLSPTRPKHGLESYGDEFGIPKPEIDDWHNLTYDEYKHRCTEDVKINTRLWQEQYAHLLELYGTHEEVVRFLRYLAFKMDCAREQERSRWKLDVEATTTSLDKLLKIEEEKLHELRTIMPPVPIREVRNPPAKPYRKDGTWSSAGLQWKGLLNDQGLPPDHMGSVGYIKGYDEPNPGSHQQIKRWLFDLGWVPVTFKTNKKKQEVPQINKSKQDGGGLCDSVKDLYDKEPNLHVLDNLFVVQHRIGILRGFLDSVSEDGYVVAKIQGLTNTLRFKHAEVVNLPKIDAAYGEDVRGALIADEGMELCGSDMSSLEDRLKQHFCFKYDPEFVREMMIPGFDPHLDLAQSAGKLSKKTVEDYKNNVYTAITKTIRGIFKNGNYACQYGAWPPKIAKTCGITLKEAQVVFDAYWKRNWSIKAVADSCKVKTVRSSQWLFNPISKFWYSLRSEKDRFSTLVQGSGVFCFDTWVAVIRRDRPQITGQFHDEVILEVKQGHREEITEWLKGTIKEVNDILKLNRELDIGIDFGNRYSEIH